jgi:hypothetical protein
MDATSSQCIKSDDFVSSDAQAKDQETLEAPVLTLLATTNLPLARARQRVRTVLKQKKSITLETLVVRFLRRPIEQLRKELREVGLTVKFHDLTFVSDSTLLMTCKLCDAASVRRALQAASVTEYRMEDILSGKSAVEILRKDWKVAGKKASRHEILKQLVRGFEIAMQNVSRREWFARSEVIAHFQRQRTLLCSALSSSVSSESSMDVDPTIDKVGRQFSNVL